MATLSRPNQSTSIASLFSGVATALVFYAVLYFAPNTVLHRYFTGHPVAYAATFLFWIASANLFVIWLMAKRELASVSSLGNSELKPSAFDSDTVGARVDAWLSHLSSLGRVERNSQIVSRIEEILVRQKRRGSSKLLNEDLRETADRDADASHDSLQLVRIIVWAIPMLGFLGTVIGITQTLGGLDFTDAQNAVDRLKAGLYVAFDTTALGLVLSVIAIFLQFPVEKKLNRLSQDLDARASAVLSGSFIEEASANEPLLAIAEMNRAVLASVSKLVETQAELWKRTVDSAHEHWTDIVGSAGDQIQSALAETIDLSLEKHAQHVESVQQQSTAEISEHWKKWQDTLGDNARILLAQQQALSEQNEMLEASGNRAREFAEIRLLLEKQGSGIESFPEMSNAMRSLARAIDVLTDRVPARDSRRAA